MNSIKAKRLLNTNQLKATPNRILLLQILSKSDKPVSVPELIQICAQNKQIPDEATIYRTIEQFYKTKIILRLDFHEGMFRYELASKKHHHHLICKKCGHIKPIYDQCLGISEQKIKKQYGFQVNQHTLEFFGLCQNCQ